VVVFCVFCLCWVGVMVSTRILVVWGGGVGGGGGGGV